MKSMSCTICHKELYSEIGKACKMCGMALEDNGKDFCSRICRNIYMKIRKDNIKKSFLLNKLRV